MTMIFSVSGSQFQKKKNDKQKDRKLLLRQYPRFSNLVEANHASSQHLTTCHAQLVSFIGRTGSGKSTLIRMLMKRPWDSVHLLGLGLHEVEGENTPLPVSGNVDSTSTTTGDVHLYAGLKTDLCDPSNLLLFADCEGLNGGSQLPLTTKTRNDVLTKITTMIETKTTHSLVWATRMLRFLRSIIVFPLDFEGSREEVVDKLFPRLLYNFSDVVVYTMPSSLSRSMEEVIVGILETAENSRKTAVNRVILPHLIVVLNMSPSEISNWDPRATTEAILNAQSSTPESSDVIRTYCRNLNQLRRHPIRTVRDLLDDCYSSIQFIRLPDAKNQCLFSQQVQTLDQLIRQAAEQATRTREEAHCLLGTASQDLMFKMAFDHYKSGLETPFDFLKSLLATNPLDAGLSSTLFALLKASMAAFQSANVQQSCRDFCSTVTPVICSFIALDSFRSHRRHHGTLRDIYRGSTLKSLAREAEESTSTYQDLVAGAIDRFFDFCCQCDFVYDGKRCVNYRQTHAIHQDESGQIIQSRDKSGKVNESGTFESTFVDECWQLWNNIIDECLDELAGDDQHPDNTPDTEHLRVWSAHSQNLQTLYKSLPELDVTEIDACSWCFRDSMLRCLDCGHRVCWKCASIIGSIEVCDFHHLPYHFQDPCHVHQELENAVVLVPS